jgi:hypothetical protein
MATTPTVADGATLAVKPPRVNIFAKPDAAHDQTDPARRQRRGVFDESAACHLTSEQASRAATREGLATYQVAGQPQRRRFALVAAAAVVAILAFAISAHLRGGSATDRPPMPATLQPRTPRAPTETGRRASRRGRDHQRKRRERHTGRHASRLRHMRTRTVAAPQARPVPSAPPAVPARPGRRVPAPAAPTRVAPAAPPEFM